jgi:hypothetical protein
MRSSILFGVLPCNPFEVSQYCGERCPFKLQSRRKSEVRDTSLKNLLASYFRVYFCLAYSLTLKKETTYLFETSADFRQTTKRYIPEDITLQVMSVRAGNMTFHVIYNCVYFLTCLQKSNCRLVVKCTHCFIVLIRYRLWIQNTFPYTREKLMDWLNLNSANNTRIHLTHSTETSAL